MKGHFIDFMKEKLINTLIFGFTFLVSQGSCRDKKLVSRKTLKKIWSKFGCVFCILGIRLLSNS